MTGRTLLPLWLALALCTAQAPAAGGGERPIPGLRAEVKPKKATVGDELVYTLTVDDPGAGLSVVLPEERFYYPEAADGKGKNENRPADAVPLYAVQSAVKNEKVRRGGKTVIVTVRLSYFRPGTHRLEEIGVYDAENVRVGYRSPEVVIEAVNQAGRFHDIEGPLDLRGNYLRLVLLIAGVLLAAAAGWIAFRYYRSRALSAVPETGPSPLDEYLKEVEGLRRPAAAGDAALYGEAASRCFRKYLSDRFGVDAMEMTAAELRDFLQGRVPPGGYLKMSRPPGSILDLWELSKFAEFSPPAAVLVDNLDASVELARRLDRAAFRARP